jgi:hypothetical protein
MERRRNRIFAVFKSNHTYFARGIEIKVTNQRLLRDK